MGSGKKKSLQLKNYTNIRLGVLVFLNLYGGIDLEMESLSVLQWRTQQKSQR